jgi:hypothetical protein
VAQSSAASKAACASAPFLISQFAIVLVILDVFLAGAAPQKKSLRQLRCCSHRFCCI